MRIVWPVIGFYYLNFLMGLDNDSITCDRTYAIIVFNDKFKQTIRLKRAVSTISLEWALSTLISENCDRTYLITASNDKFQQTLRLSKQ